MFCSLSSSVCCFILHSLVSCYCTYVSIVKLLHCKSITNTPLPSYVTMSISYLINELATQLTSSLGDGAACPNDPVIFTCTVDRTFLRWRVNPPPNHAVTDGFSQIIAGGDTLSPLELKDLCFKLL